MDHFVLAVVVMVKPCYGISMMVNICIHSKVEISLIHYVSHPIDIGCVLVSEERKEKTFLYDNQCHSIDFVFLASGSSIKIWDLETKTVADEVKSEKQCTSLAWSADGQTLFAGFTDNQIRVFEVQQR